MDSTLTQLGMGGREGEGEADVVADRPDSALCLFPWQRRAGTMGFASFVRFGAVLSGDPMYHIGFFVFFLIVPYFRIALLALKFS